MRFQSCLSTEPTGSSLAQAPRLPLLNLPGIIKRSMDLVVGLMLLALSWPWILLTAQRIKRHTPGPVFESVELLGLHCRPFQASLFRGDRNVPLSWGTRRLPLIVQVIKGEMSLVGPQPVRYNDSSALQWDELRQFTAKPGLTGPWLAQPRAASKTAGKAAAQPFADWSLKDDLAVLWRTAALALSAGRRKGKGEHNVSSGRQRQ